MALLVTTRCYRHIGGAPLESIDEATEAQQVIQRTGELWILWRVFSDTEVGPLSGNQRLTAVR